MPTASPFYKFFSDLCEANSSSSVLLPILFLSFHVPVFAYLEMLISPASLCHILGAYCVDLKSDMMSVSLEKKRNFIMHLLYLAPRKLT